MLIIPDDRWYGESADIYTPRKVMDFKKWMILACCAFLYALPFVLSQWVWWGVFFCFVPLFYLGATMPLSFKDGFMWGLLIWVLHLHGVLYSIILMARGPVIARIFPAIFIVLYQALFVGTWFLVSTKIIQWLKVQNPFLRIAVWILTSWLYFYFQVQYCLCIFNSCEGYTMMYPLLPLAEYPPLLNWLLSIGKNGLLLLLLCSNALLTACFFVGRRSIILVLFTASLFPWMASVLTTPKPKTAPAWARKVVRIPLIFFDTLNLSELAEKIQVYLRILVKKYPEATIFIFPESSFNRINLSTAGEIAQLWNAQHVSKPIHLLIGAYNWEGAAYHNSLYWIYDGQIRAVYNKRHAMVLVEGISAKWDFPFIHSLYYQITPPVTVATNPRVSFPLIEGMKLVPYICSELFFNDRPDDQYQHATIVAVCNDLWAQLFYIRRLMYLTACFKAIEWQRDTIYTSYFYGVFIDKQGTVTQLPLNAADLKDLDHITLK